MKKSARTLAALLALVFAMAVAAPAFAGDPVPTGKCNSGRGNDSESTPATDCDPGNSGGHNHGGD